MRFPALTIFGLCFCSCVPAGYGQQQQDRRDGRESEFGSRASIAESIVNRMMLFDKNKDGRLTRDEITDSRLLRLFDRADANKDGVVTKDELVALAAAMAQDEPENRDDRRGPPDGPDGGPPGGGPGGGPRSGRGGPPQPGQVLPPFLQEALKLSSDQKQQLAQLQKEVDDRLAKILTADQKKQLKQMRPGFGRGGPGGRGGPNDGPGGPDGGRPGGPGGRGGQDDGGRGPGGPGGRGPGGSPPERD
jgi:hypothetical protein